MALRIGRKNNVKDIKMQRKMWRENFKKVREKHVRKGYQFTIIAMLHVKMSEEIIGNLIGLSSGKRCTNWANLERIIIKMRKCVLSQCTNGSTHHFSRSVGMRGVNVLE